jgi:uncharacterized protein (DUF58 family)
MLTTTQHKPEPPVVDRDALLALGVLMPIKLSPLKFLPGRHPLGRAGSGLRFLRTRPFLQGEDNPRDIDKFSPKGDRQVIEWEEEAQASITILADISASMAIPFKSSLRNAAILQLTYSLWRAGDIVRTILFGSGLNQEIKAANLKNQMERLTACLSNIVVQDETDISSVLTKFMHKVNRNVPDIIFLVSDFVSFEKNRFHMDFNWQQVINRMQHNLVPVIVSFEVGSGIGGMLKVWDPERQSRRLTWFSSARVRKINQEERNRVDRLKNMFRAAGMDYLVINSQRDIYPQLAQLARIRRRRKN